MRSGLQYNSTATIKLSILVTVNNQPIPHNQLDPIWEGVFSEDDRVLWCGRPKHGRNFWEFEGQELVLHRSMLVGCVIIWIVGLLDDHNSFDGAIFSYMFLMLLTIGGFLFFWFLASSRAYVMSNLFYAVTEDCAYIIRRDGNFRMASRRYVLSFPFQRAYAYLIYPGRKYDSVQVGSLLTDDKVQPFGFGLRHPGWPVGRAVGVVPALFESIECADEMQSWLQKLTDELHN
ncbi:hypothetical protein SLH49_09340 [Cognatiyoonia sp. IB215446]|uniref:hypothetical protein n=1 Tax=Cognatiyoonia sp. IB215446 TaxID=3097355 RepID=UPI002A0C09B6|nr:hypothetical protein [Cognatiyoonia sp. IB215446]MDX8348190.1 hypothetical protein [Cognatiyoonia sp. IB215446]